jgi:hypothetical protein
MKKIVCAFLLLAIVQLGASYTLEGEWSLASIQGEPSNISVTLGEFIFRGAEIVKKITFHCCKSLAYQFSIDEDNFYLYADTER